MLSNLGVTYEELHELGNEDALAHSIAAHSAALEIIPREYADRVTVMSNLGAALLGRFEIHHLPEDLEQAQTVLLDAVTDCPPEHLDRTAILINAATALYIDVDHVTEQDLVRALALCAEASNRSDPDQRLLALVLTLQGQLQHGLAELSGSRAALDLAIDYLAHAVLTATHYQGDVPHARTALARALRLRADRYGNLNDLTRAIEQIELARIETPTIYRSSRRSRTASLAVALATRFHWTRDVADLQTAIDLLEELTTTDFHRASRHRANLAVCLTERADTTSARPDDLDRAAHLLRDLTIRSTEVSDDPVLWAALADTLLDRAESTGSADDLIEAHAVACAAVSATPKGSPAMVRHLSVLGEVELWRYQNDGRLEDLDAALQSFSDAFAVESAPPRGRIRAALLWGHCGATATRWSEAVLAHDVGQSLVPRLLAPDLLPRDGLRLIEDLAEAGPDALALSLFDGRPDLGLVRSEQWRTLVLGPDRIRRHLWTRLLAEHRHLGESLLSVMERAEAGVSPDNGSSWMSDTDE